MCPKSANEFKGPVPNQSRAPERRCGSGRLAPSALPAGAGVGVGRGASALACAQLAVARRALCTPQPQQLGLREATDICPQESGKDGGLCVSAGLLVPAQVRAGCVGFCARQSLQPNGGTAPLVAHTAAVHTGGGTSPQGAWRAPHRMPRASGSGQYRPTMGASHMAGAQWRLRCLVHE